MSYEHRREALKNMPPAVWTLDDWLRQHCNKVGLVQFSLVALNADTCMAPEDALTALFVLDDAGLVVWDQEELLVFIVGWALDHATADFVTQIAWALKADEWPETSPVLALKHELEMVKAMARPAPPALQLVADGGENVDGPKRVAGGRR